MAQREYKYFLYYKLQYLSQVTFANCVYSDDKPITDYNQISAIEKDLGKEHKCEKVTIVNIVHLNR